MDKNAEREMYWRGHVEAWQTSGETQKAYCDRYELKSHALSYWHLRLARRTLGAAEGSPLTLVPAVRVADAAAAQSGLSLTHPSGWRLEFAALPPAVWLAALCAGRS